MCVTSVIFIAKIFTAEVPENLKTEPTSVKETAQQALNAPSNMHVWRGELTKSLSAASGNFLFGVKRQKHTLGKKKTLECGEKGELRLPAVHSPA